MIVGRDNQIAEMVKAGETYTTIGRRFILTRQRVGQIAKEYALKGGRHMILENQRASIVAAFLAHGNIEKASHGTSYTQKGARRVINEAGIRIPRQPYPKKHRGPLEAQVRWANEGSERNALICSLRGKKSAAQIARELGLASRNVVIGVWYRNSVSA